MVKYSHITPEIAAAEIARRRLAAGSLSAFVNAVDVPGAPVGSVDDSWIFGKVESPIAAHHLYILDVLEKVMTGVLPRAMLFLPPGSGKSSMGSVVAPVWAMGKFPGTKIILASYGSDLARKHGRKARQLAKSPEYGAIFSTSISPDTAAADEWALVNGSEYLACGVLSGITGNRACLREDTQIVTDNGMKSIKSLYESDFRGKVLSYDINTRKLVFGQVKAVARRSSDDFYRLHSKHGSVVELTGDHRVWTGQEYREASFLAEGDSLLRVVWKGEGETGLRLDEGEETRRGVNVLRSLLRTAFHQQEVGEETPCLSRVRHPHREEPRLLLGKMFNHFYSKTQKEKKATGISSALRIMWSYFHAKKQCNSWSFLFPLLRKQGAFPCNVWSIKSWLERWCLYAKAAASGTCFKASEVCYSGAGFGEMCCVSEPCPVTYPPHRYGCNQPIIDESCNSLQEVPREIPCWREVETKKDYVQLVERVCQSTKVYDLQVEGTECFFANGILVHNSGIIMDDIVKGRQEADSEAVRNRTWDVYQEDLRTRLTPGGWEVVIATRWSEDDVAGRLLPDSYDGETGMVKCRDGREWFVVCIPAQCERPDDPIGRKIGDYLWPEWFKNDHFLPFKQIPRTWNALFQQRPSPETGTYFQRDWFKRYSPAEKPDMLHVYGSSDYAVSANTGDFTEHGVIGVDQDSDLWILDWWHGQKEADVWIDAQIDLIKLWEPFAWFGESGVIRKAISPFLYRRQMEREGYCRIEWIPSVVNKVIKARGFQGRAAMGKVHLPVGEIGDRVLDELLRFPTGRHDDVPDVLSLFCLALDQAHPAIVREAREAKYKTRAERHLDDAVRPFNEETQFGKWDTPDIPGEGGVVYYDTL